MVVYWTWYTSVVETVKEKTFGCPPFPFSTGIDAGRVLFFFTDTKNGRTVDDVGVCENSRTVATYPARYEGLMYIPCDIFPEIPSISSAGRNDRVA